MEKGKKELRVSSPVCRLIQVRRAFKSGFVLGPVDLVLPRGQIVGLLGQNGAGKTTLIRILMGFLRFQGRVVFDGEAFDWRSKRRIGYVDEEPVIYDWMDSRKLEWFLSRFYTGWDSSFFRQLLEQFRIPARRRFAELSRGNQVKLSICGALAHRPELLVMDEPTSGLDPVVRQEILKLLDRYIQENPGSSILFSSHITTDLEQICDHVVILEEGRVLMEMSLSDRNPDGTRGGIAFSAWEGLTLEQVFLRALNRNDWAGGPDHRERVC